MTRTKRIYNKRPTLQGPGYKGWVSSMKIAETELYKSEWRDYHPWKQHGRQRGMKDWRIDTKRRQARKAEERMAYLIEGILTGLEDFISGRCKHFKDDEELEEYLMGL